jgi:hypothetical protein
MSLIFLAPTPEKAGQADKIEAATKPTPDGRPAPAAALGKVEPASFDGDLSKQKNAKD